MILKRSSRQLGDGIREVDLSEDEKKRDKDERWSISYLLYIQGGERE